MFKRALSFAAGHVSHFRTVYIYPLLGIGLLLAAIHGVFHLTGRAVIDDPGVLAASALLFLRAILLVALVDLTQTILFGYRANRAGTSKFDDVFDALVSIFLLVGGYWILFKN